MAVEQAVRWTHADDGCVAHLTGEIDIANAETVFAAVKAGRSGDKLIVDLTDVTFIDSSGLGQIVRAWKQSCLRLVAPAGRQPRSVLKLTDLNGAIPTFDTVEAALNHG
jgi:anti-sigma B factor antagonist